MPVATSLIELKPNSKLLSDFQDLCAINRICVEPPLFNINDYFVFLDCRGMFKEESVGLIGSYYKVNDNEYLVRIHSNLDKDIAACYYNFSEISGNEYFVSLENLMGGKKIDE